LGEGNQRVFADFKSYASGDNLFKTFAERFEERDGAIGGRVGHVGLSRLGNDGDDGIAKAGWVETDA
jgi:hypothetical protein